MKKTAIFVLIFWCFAFAASAVGISAAVNRNPVPLGEAFVLSVKSDENQKPDFSVLEKDFDIYSVSNSSRSSYVNGNFTKFFQWDLALMPKALGEFIIPAFSNGKAQSKPIALKVEKGKVDAASGSESFSFTAAADTKYPFRMQQVTYEATLRSSVPLQGNLPYFEDSAAKNWMIYSLDKPQSREIVENGVTLYETTLRYALFPMKDGIQDIPAMRFDGYYIDNNSAQNNILSNDVFNFSAMFGQKKPVRLQTEPIAITVRKVPPEYTAQWWLPADSLTFTSDWQQHMPLFQIGEVTKRTVTLTAVGAVDVMIPQINFPNVDGMKQYAEKPVINTTVEDGKVYTTMSVTNVYMPQRQGKITIPAMTIDWFNAKTRKPEQAVLPAIDVNVMPGHRPTAADYGASRGPASQEGELLAMWNFILVIMAFGLGVFCAYLWRRPKPETKPESEKKNGPAVDGNKLTKYCSSLLSRSLPDIRDELLRWGQKKFGKDAVCNLDDLVQKVNDDKFTAAVDNLNRALYSREQVPFNREAFRAAFWQVNLQTKRKKKDSPLPKLYD